MGTILITIGLGADASGALMALWPDIERDAGNTMWFGRSPTLRRVGAVLLVGGFILQGVGQFI